MPVLLPLRTLMNADANVNLEFLQNVAKTCLEEVTSYRMWWYVTLLRSWIAIGPLSNLAWLPDCCRNCRRLFVEAVRKWTHYLLGRKFTIVTDQRSVTFMYSVKHLRKIKIESDALVFALKWVWLRYRLPSRENERCPWCLISCLLRRCSQKHAVWSARCSVPSWCDALVSFPPFKKFSVHYKRR